MAIVTVPLHQSIGARIIGIDLGQPVDPATLQAIREALERWHVLVFPDQNLSPAAQVAFSRHFGELEAYPQAFSQSRDFPEIFMVSTVDEGGNQIPLADPRARFLRLTERWHIDSSYQTVPSYGSVYCAIEVPDDAGDMFFADLREAWSRLPDHRKREIEGLTAVHDFARSRTLDPGLPPLTAEEAAAVPPVRHPLVRRHADGRSSLFISDWITAIDGLAPDATERLVNWLTLWATKDSFLYRHHWRPGDVLLADNTCTLNAIEPFDRATVRRILRRTTIRGVEGV